MSTNYIKQITDTAGTTHDILESVDTRIFRGTCPTAAATANKIVTLDDATNFTQTAGVRVAVTFTYGNTAATPTLQVNNNYARNIVMATSATTTSNGNGTTYNTWGAGETVIFTYTSSNTWMQNGSSLSIYNTYALADSKITDPSTKSSGQYLKYNGTNWVADNVTAGVSDVQVNGTSILSSGVANIVTNTAYNSSSNKIATMSDLSAAGGIYIVDTSEQVNWPEVVEAYNQGKVIIAQHAFPYENPELYNLVRFSYDDPQNPSEDDYMGFTLIEPKLETTNNSNFEGAVVKSLYWDGSSSSWDARVTQTISSYDGVVQSDLTFLAQDNIGGPTPALRFQRVLLTDSRTDWQMYGDDSNNIVFQQKTGNNAWTTEATLTPAGNLTVPSVSLTTGTISTTPSNSTDIVNKSYVDSAMTVVTFTPDSANNSLIISVQLPSSIQNGNEESY